MDPFARFLSMSIIPIALCFIGLSIDKNNSKELLANMTKEHVIMRLPKAYAYIGLLGVIFFLGLIVFAYYSTNAIWVFILFAAFILLGIILIYGRLFWKIEVFRNEDYFLFRNVPFKTKKIFYRDCQNYMDSKSGTSIKLKTSKRNIYIDINASNLEIFIATLNKNGIREIKKYLRPKRKPRR